MTGDAPQPAPTFPTETEGELIELVWPDGNDEGELFIRGHIPAEVARQRVLDDSEELTQLAENAVVSDNITALVDDTDSDARIQALAAQWVEKARVEHLHAYWSEDHDLETQWVIATTSTPSPESFAVTRLTLWPTTPCLLVPARNGGGYWCQHCDRYWQIPADNPRQHLSAVPVMCPERTGDEQDALSEAMTPLTEKQTTRSN